MAKGGGSDAAALTTLRTEVDHEDHDQQAEDQIDEDRRTLAPGLFQHETPEVLDRGRRPYKDGRPLNA